MRVTSVKVKKTEGREDSRLLGYADITIDNAIAIHNIKIVKGDEHMFLSFPSNRRADGTYSDIVHPINSAVRKDVEDAVLKEFEAAE